MKNFLRISALISVMLALLLTGTLVIATTPAQTQYVSQVFQHYDAVSQAITSPPVNLVSSEKNTAQITKLIIVTAAVPETWIPYRSLDVVATSPPFSHGFAKMVVTLTPADGNQFVQMEKLSKLRMVNDAGGNVVASYTHLYLYQKQFSAVSSGCSFST